MIGKIITFLFSDKEPILVLYTTYILQPFDKYYFQIQGISNTASGYSFYPGFFTLRMDIQGTHSNRSFFNLVLSLPGDTEHRSQDQHSDLLMARTSHCVCSQSID